MNAKVKTESEHTARVMVGMGITVIAALIAGGGTAEYEALIITGAVGTAIGYLLMSLVTILWKL